MICPNINSDEWKNLANRIGVRDAYREFVNNNGVIPSHEKYQDSFKGVNATLKVIGALNSPKMRGVFDKFFSSNKEKFYSELLNNGANKDQVALLKDWVSKNNPKSLPDMQAGLAAEMSYTVEINERTESYSQMIDEGRLDENAIDFAGNREVPSSHYENMTVPGGVNYRENEIRTPNITPIRQGHAQFSTDNGIGWFRSDDQRSDDNKGKKVLDGAGGLVQEGQIGSKTRRILEVQSDLFQKERSNEVLTTDRKNLDKSDIDDIKEDLQDGKITQQQYNEILNSRNNKNSFLQLLNKDNAWTTFFIKSIIQDSARKGYENVLFPSGETTAKVEGHETLEGFLENTQRSIDSLKERLTPGGLDPWFNSSVESIQRAADNNKEQAELGLTPLDPKHEYTISKKTIDSKYEFSRVRQNYYNREGKYGNKNDTLTDDNYNGWVLYEYTVGKGNKITKLTDKEAQALVKKDGDPHREKDMKLHKEQQANVNRMLSDKESVLKEEKSKTQREIDNLNQEMENARTGRTKLSSVADFYENTIQNILKKQGYNPRAIVDKHGNQWFTVSTDQKRDNSTIYLQLSKNQSSLASPETLGKINNFLDRIGVSKESVQNIVVDGTRLGANGVARVMAGIVSIIEDKDDIALPEEAMHFAVELIQQKNSVMYNQMLNKIGQYNMYQQVLNDYKDVYKNAEGLPDIPKIKKEAIAKVLAETIINKNQGNQESAERLLQTKTWWDRFIDFFKSLLGKAGINPFETVANDINEGKENLGKALDLTKDETYYQKRDDLVNKIHEENAKIGALANGHISRDGQEVKRTVTGLVDEYYDSKRRSRNLSEDDARKALREYKEATAGAGSKDIQDILGRYIGDNNKLRDKVLSVTSPSALSASDRTFYNTLEANIKARLNTYPGGTEFIHGVNLYDSKEGIVGKADLIAITPDGKLDLLQFKFPNINNKEGVLKSYEQTAYNIEIEKLRSILQKGYGVQKEDFNLTRAIPIRAYYARVDKEGATKGTKLVNLKIGSVNVKAEEDESLLPVASESESTGSKELDKLLSKMRGLLDKLQNEKPGNDISERTVRLATLQGAIRTLQVKRDATKTLDNAKLLLKRSEDLYTALQKQIIEADPSQMSLEQVNKLSGDLLDSKDNLLLYKDLDLTMEDIYPSASEEEKKFIDGGADVARRAGRLIRNIETLEDRVRTKLIAAKMGIKDELNPEKAITWYKRMIRSLSQSPIKAGAMLWDLVKAINNKYQFQFSDRFKNLEHHMKKVNDWAKANGGMKEVYNKIFKFDDKGRWKGRFISQTDKAFYEGLEEAKTKGNHEWVKENIDIVAYKEWYNRELAEREERSLTQRLSADDEQNAALVKKNLQDFIDNYDIDKKTAVNKYNNVLNANPKAEKWRSKEFAELHKVGNEPLLELYNYWQDVLKQSHEAGLIQAFEKRTFFPNVRKEYLEKTLYTPSAIAGSFIDNMRIASDDEAFGKQDPLTGEPIDNIHAAYVYDLGKQALDTDGNYFDDYSQKSMDLFKVMALWEKELIRFNLKGESESIAKLIASTESRKRALQVNRVGNLVKDKGAPIEIDNTTNTKYIKDFIDAIYYGKRLDNEHDFTLNIPYGNAVRAINKLFGREVFTVPKEDAVKVSGIKGIQTFNRYFVAKTLGANPLTALSQLFGGTTNAYINSGKFFTKADLLAGQAKMVSGAFYDQQGKIQAGLLQYFLPTLEDQTGEKIRELSVNNAVKYLSSDHLMFMQRKADAMVQIPIALAFFDNTMIRDGKLVNIREFAKQQGGYDNIYSLPYEDQKAAKDAIEKQINEFKAKESLIATAKVVNDSIVLPGIERGDQTTIDYRQRIIEFVKDALGNTSNEDLSLYKRSVMMQSFFMFKNWIPRMVDVRGRALEYNPGTDSYEWGRIRMVFNALRTSGLGSIGSILKSIGGNEKNIIETAKKAYSQKQADFASQGEDFNMSEGEFIDMYIKGVRSEFKELALTMALLGILVFARVNAPPKDDDSQTKGMYKWTLRGIDKLTDELSFFYDPTSFTNIANGSVFPAVSILTDAQRFMLNGLKDAYYFSTGNEQGMKSIHTTKYILKSLPLINQIMAYSAVFSSDFAKEWGIQISSQNGRR